MRSNKPHFRTIIKGDIDSTYSTLVRNIEEDIQFNHSINYPRYLSKYDNRIIKNVINDMLRGSSEKVSLATINNQLVKLKNYKELLLDNSECKLEIKLGKMNLKHIPLSDLEKLVELTSTTPRKSFKVPKNSDKASLESREFKMKPLFQEVLLSHFFIQSDMLAKEISIPSYLSSSRKYHTKNKSFTSKPKYIPFGSFFNYDASSRKIRFSNYIVEYNKFQNTFKNNTSKYEFCMYFDLKKFFDTIPHVSIAELISNYLIKQNKSSRIVNNVKKLLMEILATTENQEGKGLSIESHSQHTIANAFLNTVINDELTAVMNRNKNVGNKYDFEIISYVDDFIIFSNNKGEVKRIFEAITSILASYGIEIAEQKTSEIMYTESAEVKKLTRLPATSYLEAINTDNWYNEDNEENLASVLLFPYDMLFNTMKLKHKEEDFRIKIKFFNKGDFSLEKLATETYDRETIDLLPNYFSNLIYRYKDTQYKNIDETTKSKILMKLQDIDFWRENRDSFIFDYETALTKIDDINDDNILETLQYFYLCIPNSTQDIYELRLTINALTKVCLVEKSYGSKAKFLTGIFNRLNFIWKMNIDPNGLAKHSTLFSPIEDPSLEGVLFMTPLIQPVVPPEEELPIEPPVEEDLELPTEEPVVPPEEELPLEKPTEELIPDVEEFYNEEDSILADLELKSRLLENFNSETLSPNDVSILYYFSRMFNKDKEFYKELMSKSFKI